MINGISAEVQSQLVLSVISSLHDAKVNVLALVMDGHTINQNMVNLLGCKIMSDTINSSIPHPSDNSQNVYIFFDACHLLKNIRGALHALPKINTSVGTARWTDIVRLQELQASEGLHAGNKFYNQTC